MDKEARYEMALEAVIEAIGLVDLNAKDAAAKAIIAKNIALKALEDQDTKEIT
jgi:hypothetical protein